MARTRIATAADSGLLKSAAPYVMQQQQPSSKQPRPAVSLMSVIITEPDGKYRQL